MPALFIYLFYLLLNPGLSRTPQVDAAKPAWEDASWIKPSPSPSLFPVVCILIIPQAHYKLSLFKKCSVKQWEVTCTLESWFLKPRVGCGCWHWQCRCGSRYLPQGSRAGPCTFYEKGLRTSLWQVPSHFNYHQVYLAIKPFLATCEKNNFANWKANWWLNSSLKKRLYGAQRTMTI